MIEPGFIVHPGGSHEVWKSKNVSEINGFMNVWGSPFYGDRLDLLINDIDTDASEGAQEKALQAVTHWIRAKMLLGDTDSAVNPGAAFILCEDGKEPGNFARSGSLEVAAHPAGSVFFAPENLSNRCLFLEGLLEQNQFNCPDLKGAEAAAFCAGAMLYKILVKKNPYASGLSLSQDMREGIFVPPHIAAPGLDKELCELIISALLLPDLKRRTGKTGTDIISELLNVLTSGKTDIPSLFRKLTAEETAQLESEKKAYITKYDKLVKVKRFAARNRTAIIVSAVIFIFLLFTVISTIRNLNERPTTAGMESDTVVLAYYDAFSTLDHIFMEACIMGATKVDINAVASLFAIVKTRQAYELNADILIPAQRWKAEGGELPAPNVFGVTDLSIEFIKGSEAEEMYVYNVNYLLWAPGENAIYRYDLLTLRRDKRGNWRITEIQRTER